VCYHDKILDIILKGGTIPMIKRYKPVLLLLILVAVNYALYRELPRFRFNAIVIHHSASQTDNYRTIRAFHRRRHRWRDAAYHLILSNGSTDVPSGLLEGTGRYHHLSYSVATRNFRYNLTAVHLCIVGNYHAGPLSDELKAPLAHAVETLQKRYRIPNERVLFHRDVSPSLCPGKFITHRKMRRWLAEEASRCPEAVRGQHRKVISDGSYSLYSAPRGLLPVAFGISFLVSVLWISFWGWRDSRRIRKVSEFSTAKRFPESRY
jgi:hypothetical protein